MMNEQIGCKKTRIWSSWSVSISIIIALSLLATCILSVRAAGAPDLVVKNLKISPLHPETGDRVKISTQVLNRGSDDTRRFYVRLYVNGERIEYKPIIFGLDAGETESINFTWIAQPGHNELEVVVDDPFDKIDESNEDNNSWTQGVRVSQLTAGKAATDINLAVVRFQDKSNSGFANTSSGLADMLTESLVNSGFNVLERREIESILFEKQLNPSDDSDLAEASSLAGADALVAGSLTDVDITESRIDMGFLSVTGATVSMNISYRLINAYTGEIISSGSLTETADGQTSASFDMGGFISSVSQGSTDVCAGGFRTDKNVYAPGEVITIGYLDDNPSNTFTVQFYDSNGFSIGPPMSSNYKFSTFSNPCVTWNWNPSPALTPGDYTVRLYDYWSNLISAKNFTVNVGANPPTWINQITFGTREFSNSVVGEAVEKALSRVSSGVVNSLNSSASTLLTQRNKYNGQTNGDTGDGKLRCQVGTIVNSDTVTLTGVEGNCGKGEGVEDFNIFYVFPEESVKVRGEFLEPIPDNVEPKGRVVVVNVFEETCEAQLIGSFSPSSGDLAIPE